MVRMNSSSTAAISVLCSAATLPRKSTAPSDLVGPGRTEFTVTPVPATVSAMPRDSASCAVLVTP